MSRRLREIVLLSLGVITPLGILAVNISAFVMGHLPALRLIIAGCALVSGLVLNGLTAWWVLRLASRNANPLYREYRTWAIGAAVLIVALTAGGGRLPPHPSRRGTLHPPPSPTQAPGRVLSPSPPGARPLPPPAPRARSRPCT